MATCHVEGCDQPVVAQWQRHADDAEFAAIPQQLRPIDGLATVPVYGCEQHELMPFCCHDGTEPAPCPICGATSTACTNPDGSPRHRNHASRPTSPPVTPCRHYHRTDCPGHGGCACSAGDEPPARPRQTHRPRPDGAAIHADLERRANAERAYWADLLKRYGGDKQAAQEAARGEYVARVIDAGSGG